jgi:hypothetical protein
MRELEEGGALSLERIAALRKKHRCQLVKEMLSASHLTPAMFAYTTATAAVATSPTAPQAAPSAPSADVPSTQPVPTSATDEKPPAQPRGTGASPSPSPEAARRAEGRPSIPRSPIPTLYRAATGTALTAISPRSASLLSLLSTHSSCATESTLVGSREIALRKTDAAAENAKPGLGRLSHTNTGTYASPLITWAVNLVAEEINTCRTHAQV